MGDDKCQDRRVTVSSEADEEVGGFRLTKRPATAERRIELAGDKTRVGCCRTKVESVSRYRYVDSKSDPPVHGVKKAECRKECCRIL